MDDEKELRHRGATDHVLPTETKKDLHTLLDNIVTQTWFLTDDHTYGAVNRAHAVFSGLEIGDMAYRDMYDFFPREVVDVCRQSNEEVFRTGRPLHTEEWMADSSGEMRLLSIRKIPQVAEDGTVTSVVCSAEDITEQKEAEEALRQTNWSLNRASARAAEMARKAEAASKAKGSFLANMSHEIRTPMNAVIGLSQLLLQTPLDDRQQGYLNKILSSSQMLLAIINDILDYSKIESDRLELESHCFRVQDLLDRMVALFGPTAEEKGLGLVIEARPDVPPLLVGDFLRLSQILTNLLGNAVKFTSRGEVRLEISRRGGDEEKVSLLFAVIDTGIGLDPEKWVSILQPFSQADSSTTRNYGGTGLGLAISNRLIEAMGGVLSIESCLDKGSQFSFSLTLPIGTEKPDGTSRREQAPSIPSLKGRTILLVEDNEINQEVTRLMVERTGAQVLLATQGAEAVLAARTHSPDLILMDLQMPLMDGFEATRLIREEDRTTPIIALSAAAMATDRARTKEAGMNDHLAKPVDGSLLYETLRQWLEPDEDVAEGPPCLPSPKQLPPFLPGFDLSQGMDCLCGDEVLYHRLLVRFGERMDEDYGPLSLLLQEGHLASAQAVVHALKGVAATLGAVRLQEVAQSLNQTLRSGLSVDKELIDEMVRALEEAQRALATLPPLPQTEPAGPTQGGMALALLHDNLTGDELVEMATLDLAMGFLLAQGEAMSSTEKLRALVDAFRTEEALALLGQIMERRGISLP